MFLFSLNHFAFFLIFIGQHHTALSSVSHKSSFPFKSFQLVYHSQTLAAGEQLPLNIPRSIHRWGSTTTLWTTHHNENCGLWRNERKKEWWGEGRTVWFPSNTQRWIHQELQAKFLSSRVSASAFPFWGIWPAWPLGIYLDFCSSLTHFTVHCNQKQPQMANITDIFILVVLVMWICYFYVNFPKRKPNILIFTKQVQVRPMIINF